MEFKYTKRILVSKVTKVAKKYVIAIFFKLCIVSIAEKYRPKPGVEPSVSCLTYERSNKLSYPNHIQCASCE